MRRITLDGRTQSIEAWAAEIGLTPGTLAARLDRYTVRDALTRPRRWRGPPSEAARLSRELDHEAARLRDWQWITAWKAAKAGK